MKCEKCNNEANFYWTSTINGKTEQHCFCTDCAQKEGYGELFDRRVNEMFSSPFGMLDDFFGDRFFNDGFFGGGLLPGFARSFFSPMLTMERPRALTGETEKKCEDKTATAQPEKIAEGVPGDAGSEIKTRRELNALKHQLKEAVRAENYEKAIELRDKIKEMEKAS